MSCPLSYTWATCGCEAASPCARARLRMHMYLRIICEVCLHVSIKAGLPRSLQPCAETLAGEDGPLISFSPSIFEIKIGPVHFDANL